MKGYIKMETTEQGELKVDVSLSEVDTIDRLQVIHAVCNALEIEPTELWVIAHFMALGGASLLFDIKSLKCSIAPEDGKDDNPSQEMIKKFFEYGGCYES